MEIPSKQLFLNEILGESGQKILKKAIDRNPYIEPIVYFLATHHWLKTCPDQHCGLIPGTEHEIVFKKSEVGYGGTLYDGEVYEFLDIPSESLAAYVMSCLEIKKAELEEVDEKKLTKLSKSIELLVKSCLLKKLKKAGAGTVPNVPKVKAPQAGLPAQNAKPKEPVAPEAADKTQSTDKDKMPESFLGTSTTKIKLPRVQSTKRTPSSSFSMAKSDIATNCPACGQEQFDGNVVKECVCFTVLAKGCDVSVGKDKLTFTFNKQWDQDAIETFLTGLRK